MCQCKKIERYIDIHAYDTIWYTEREREGERERRGGKGGGKKFLYS